MNRLPFDKQVAVIAALCEGMSIRGVERLAGVHRDTIMRLGFRAGVGCGRLHDYLFSDLNVGAIQIDELWSFIGKKQRRLKDGERLTKGDFYTFVALDSTNKAIIAYRVGKRDGDTTELFVTDLKSRILNVPVISSDAFRFYEPSIRRIFGRRVRYGQAVKVYKDEAGDEARPVSDPEGPEPPSPASAARRYSPGVVIGIDRRRIIGRPPLKKISTSHAERQNLSVRMASRRFTRLTNGYSKKVEHHAAAVSLYVAHYNFCRVHGSLRITPAMALGVTDHVWSVAELVEVALSGRVPARQKLARRRRQTRQGSV